MKQVLLTIILFFSVVLLQANDKKVIVKKMVVSTDQEEKNVDVNVEVEDDILTLTITQNGNEDVFKVNLTDEKALEALKNELKNLDINVDVMAFMGDDEDVFVLGNDHASFHHNVHGGGYLGVQIKDLTDQLRDYFKVKGDGGVLVAEVVKDSPAEKAGLEAGDIITKVNDVYISNAGELTQTIRKEKPESEAEITFIRKGREKSLKATLGTSDDSYSWSPKMRNLHKKNFKLHEKMMENLGHVCSTDCDTDCPLKGKIDLDMDFRKIIPKHFDGIKDYKFQFKVDKQDDLEKLKDEVEKLKEELEKLKDS